jgi:hypothetical protein
MMTELNSVIDLNKEYKYNDFITTMSTNQSQRRRVSKNSQQIVTMSFVVFFVCCLFSIGHVSGFATTCSVLNSISTTRTTISQRQFIVQHSMTADYVEESSNNDFGDDFGDTSGVLIEDLSWRVEKQRLEERNKKRFLKAKPRFLPYEDGAKWVQAWGHRWTTQEDWYDYSFAELCLKRLSAWWLTCAIYQLAFFFLDNQARLDHDG